MFPLISIVTINYNQAEMTARFLESARLLTYPNYEILVVDNASATPARPVLAPLLDERVILIENAENQGFAGGNNVGIAAARGEYFFIVNNDTELTPGILESLLQPFTADPQVGVVCPKIRYFDHPTRIQYAGYNAMNPFTGKATAVGSSQTDSGQFDQPGPTHFAHGCAMLVSRRVVKKVGRFAERFFLYYEELDWSERIKKAGFTIFYQPSALILHKESQSVGRGSPLKTYYLTRNRILFMRRHVKLPRRLVFYLFFAGCVLPKHVISYLLRGQRRHAGAFLRGVGWNLVSPSTSVV